MNGHVLITLTLALLVTSMITVEMRNLRTTVFLYWAHSVLLCATIATYARVMGNPSLYLWALTCFVTKVVAVPLLMWAFLRRAPAYEYRPVIGFGVSLAILSAIEIAFFKLFQNYAFLLAPTEMAQEEPVRSLLAGAFTVFILGIYALVTRRDTLKTVIGLALMENGVHLVLLALSPGLPETTMIGILTNVVVVIAILLYISTSIYEVFGITDTAKLSELRR